MNVLATAYRICNMRRKSKNRPNTATIQQRINKHLDRALIFACIMGIVVTLLFFLSLI